MLLALMIVLINTDHNNEEQYIFADLTVRKAVLIKTFEKIN